MTRAPVVSSDRSGQAADCSMPRVSAGTHHSSLRGRLKLSMIWLILGLYWIAETPTCRAIALASSSPVAAAQDP